MPGYLINVDDAEYRNVPIRGIGEGLRSWDISYRSSSSANTYEEFEINLSTALIQGRKVFLGNTCVGVDLTIEDFGIKFDPKDEETYSLVVKGKTRSMKYNYNIRLLKDDIVEKDKKLGSITDYRTLDTTYDEMVHQAEN